MSIHAKLAPGGLTYDVQNYDVDLTANAAFQKGEVVMCDIDSNTGRFVSCTAPSSASLGAVSSAICSDGVFGVVLSAVASGATAKVRIRGLVQAVTQSTSNTAWATDSIFIVKTGVTYNATSTTVVELDQGAGTVNQKWVARGMEAIVSGMSTPQLRTLHFNGLEGFGRYGGTTS